MENENIIIYNEDCIKRLPKLKANSIDLVIVDLPYGQTDCKWDVVIDLEKMWKGLKKCCKHEATYVFFCTVKFGHSIIASNESWFRYDLVWEKLNSVGFLNAKKLPMRKHEMIYIFQNPNQKEDTELKLNTEMRKYAEKVFNYIGKSKNEISTKLGNRRAEHFFRYNSSQFSYPTEETYKKLTKEFKLNKMEGYIERKDFPKYEKYNTKRTYNPQMTKGKPFKGKTGSKINLYSINEAYSKENKGTRYPKSIITCGYDKDKFHPTQKPQELLQWLVKTYSNENETVLDFTMGSGSTGIACLETDRKFIGIEKDETIYNTALKRIEEYIKKNKT